MDDIAYLDDLTGVRNRRYLNLIKEEKNSLFSDTLTVVMTDIDHFKNINDTYGHLKGDEIIKGYAEFLTRSLRKDDVIIRYGGDEFIIFQPGMKKSDAKIVWQRIIDRLKKEQIGGMNISISVGLASFPEDGSTLDNLIETADKGLYDAKRSGRGRIGFERREHIIVPAREFIDRKKELEEIKEGLARQDVILIRGEAGVGKTRLVKEGLSSVRNVEVLWSDCVPFSRQLSYYPVRNIIKYKIKRNPGLLSDIPLAYKVEISKLVPEIRELITEREIEEVGDVLDRYRLYEGFVRVIGSGEKDKVIVIDNIQWMDEDSVEALRYIVRSGDFSATYIFVSRVEERNEKAEDFLKEIGRERRIREIELRVFDRSTSKKLIVAILGEGYDDALYDYVISASGGNPFYIEEIMKSLYEMGHIPQEKHERFIPPTENLVPRGIEDVVERKFRRLSKEAQEVVKVGSVLGYVDIDLVKEITGYNEGHLIGLIEEGMENGILMEGEDDKILFRGEVIRDIIYRNEIGKLKRKFLHRKIANWLKDSPHASLEELAYHFKEAKDFENTFIYSKKAARASLKVYAYKEALKFYNWAAESLSHIEDSDNVKVEDKIDLYINRGNVLNVIGYKKEAEDEIRKAINLAKENNFVEKLCDAIIELATIHWNIGENEKTLNEGLEVLKIARENGLKDKEMSALNSIGIAYNNMKDFENALKYYEEGLKIAREIDDRTMQGVFLNNMGIIYNDRTEYEKAIQCYEESLKHAEEVGNKLQVGNTLNNIGAVYHDRGDYEKALFYYNKALEVCRFTGDRNLEATVLDNIGMIYDATGRVKESANIVKMSLKIAEELGDRMQVSHSLCDLGDILLNMGKFKEAEENYSRALQISLEIGDPSGEVYAYLGLGDAYTKEGEYDIAEEYYKKALKIATTIEEKVALHLTYLQYFELLLEKGDIKKARELMEKAKEVNAQISSVSHEIYGLLAFSEYYLVTKDVGKVEELVNRIEEVIKKIDTPSIISNYEILKGRFALLRGDVDMAIKSLNKALEISRALDYTPRQATVLYYLADASRRSGKMEEARQYFEGAAGLFEKLGMKAWLAKVNEELEK